MDASVILTPTDEPETEQPLIRLDLYPSVVRMTQYNGPTVATYPVSPLDVAAAWTDTPVSSGFLPRDALFWLRRDGADMLAIFVPARQWRVTGDDAPYLLPLPPLVFCGWRRSYVVYAVKRRPTSPQTDLYRAPCPNVYTDGRICPGDVPFPVCSAETIYDALSLFLEGSRFNRHLIQGKSAAFPNDVYELWRALDGKRRFPLAHLVPVQRQLAHLMR